MEFDVGTLLYIVVTIIALVASVVGKKKSKPASESPEGEKKTGFFEQLEEQFGGMAAETKGAAEKVFSDKEEEDDNWFDSESDEQDDNKNNEYDEEIKETAPSAYSNYEGVYNPDKQAVADRINAESENSADEDNAIEIIDLESSDYPNYFEIVKDFDLGTAVVYSTIINRKEY
ncbi:MAG TPA: hypothetical protein VJ951_02585 [Bacteroidales bacterium]|nr:hypothetical protein [Bacteroidales bacterium]